MSIKYMLAQTRVCYNWKLVTTIFMGFILLPLIDAVAATSVKPAAVESIVIANANFSYALLANGQNLHFIDKASGVDYLDGKTPSYCAYVSSGGKSYPVTGVSLKGGLLKLVFESAGVQADVRVTTAKDYITLEVLEVTGKAESLNFINVPLKLEGLPYEPFAACVLSMNLQTHVRQLPALQTHLWANCYSRFGMKGSEITLLGVPMQRILPTIRSVMSKAKDIPHSKAGGAWAQLSKAGYGSYLMNFGSLTEANVDEWIEKCASVGFDQIDHQGGTPDFFKFGSFELNPKKWPDGWNNFKRINARLGKAGISSIFHTYAFFIDKDSRYVTPVPSKDLGYFNAFTLKEGLNAVDSTITVNESTANISTITGFFIENSRILHIGNELIEFNGATKVPPYRFTGCKRAANGTKASAHVPGEKGYHLKEMFGRLVPGPETPLFTEIARNTAEVVNEGGFDGIYFDAIDGSNLLNQGESYWYDATKFVFEVAKHLKRPVGMEMSAMLHHWWHYRSRWQAWDTPRRGFKQFIDIHTASIKSSVNENSTWEGDSTTMSKMAPLENGGLLLPLHLGWWLNFAWEPPQTETTFIDDLEYLGCKMIGNNAGLSLIGGVEEKELQETPAFRRLNATLKQYETLRKSGYFSEKVKKILRQPKKEFTLFKAPDNSWNFKPVAYERHKVSGVDHPSSKWVVNNEFDTQPVKLRIAPLLSVKAYDDPTNIILTDFSKNEFNQESIAKGVFGEIKATDEKALQGEIAGVFSASSSGVSPVKGSWISMEKKFEPWINLNKNQGLGVWIHGDGNGQLLNLRIGGPLHLSHGARGDHFVKIDFTGWKYFELVEIESSEFSNYSWPTTGSIYNSYLNAVDFNSVDKLQLWYNNLPAGKEVSCKLGPVKAISTVSAVMENPSVTVGGEKITFPVRMESGMYLEFSSLTDCKLYGAKGDLIKEVIPVGHIPKLLKGKNELGFHCDSSAGINPRVQVTVISEGKPLQKD